jgi:hypothetical protein
MEASGQLHTPAILPQKKELLITHWIGGWVGPKAGLDAVEKKKISFPLPRIEPRPFSP